MRIIAFTGPKGSGKDTAAKCLFKHNQGHNKKLFRHAPMAEGVKNVCEDFFGWDLYDMSLMEFKETPRPYWPGGPVLEPRWAMMDIANWLRERFGGGIHAARWAMHAEHYDNAMWGAHVTTDMRFPEELDVFKQHELLVIYVHRTVAEEALAKKRSSGDAMALDVSESYYPMLLEYAREHGAVVNNDREIHHLHAEVNTVVSQKFGHWKYWSDLQPLITNAAEEA